MATAPGSRKKVLIVLGSIALLVLGGVGFVGYQATRPIDPGWIEKVNATSLSEAHRKIRLVTEAQRTAKRGFVGLSELEVNSYLTEITQEALKNTKTNTTGAPTLRKSYLEIAFDGLTWDVSLQKKIYGQSLDLFWDRTVQIQPGAKVEFTPIRMRLGKITVPKMLWPHIEKAFGEVDNVYRSQFDLVSKLPSIAITTNATSKKPELKLYSYPAGSDK